MAIAKTVYLRPDLNRYISGRRYYQRHEITLGFVAKKRFEDHSEEKLVVTTAPEDWTLTAVTRQVVGKVHKARTEKSGGANGAMDILKVTPPAHRISGRLPSESQTYPHPSVPDGAWPPGSRRPFPSPHRQGCR